MQSANNAGPDQPARMRRLIGAFVVRLMDAVVYFDEQRMFRSDCTDAHAHLDLRCSHITRAFFSRCALYGIEYRIGMVSGISG